MGLLDTLLSDATQQQSFQDFANRYQQGSPAEGYSNQEALQRYQQVVPNLSQQEYLNAAEQSFSRLSPQDRQQFGQYMQQQGAPGFGGSNTQYQDPGVLAQLLGQTHQQQPGLLGSLLGGAVGGGAGGNSGVGGMLSSPVARSVMAGIAAAAVSHAMGGNAGGLVGNLLGGNNSQGGSFI